MGTNNVFIVGWLALMKYTSYAYNIIIDFFAVLARYVALYNTNRDFSYYLTKFL